MVTFNQKDYNIGVMKFIFHIKNMDHPRTYSTINKVSGDIRYRYDRAA
jgi:hypothetical protein